MKNEIDVLCDLSHKFDQVGVAYMLTGSIAMNYYTQPRMTRDINIVVALNRSDIDSVVKLLEKEYYINYQSITDSLIHESIFNLIHQESVIKVDCIVRKRNKYRLLEFERRQKIVIQDFTTYIVSKEDLILSKLLWAKDSHSEFQLRDVRNLLESGYDTVYLETWTVKLGVNYLLQECLNG